jgi:hypothetical protein
MNRITKKQLDELVGGDITKNGGNTNIPSNREIQTGPIEKPFNDDSYYEKGMPTFTDVVFARYRQNIPWFAVYSFGGTRTGGITINYGLKENTIIEENNIEEIIEDLVKRKNISDVNSKDYNPKLSKILDEITDLDLSEEQIEELLNVITSKKDNQNKTKNI